MSAKNPAPEVPAEDLYVIQLSNRVAHLESQNTLMQTKYHELLLNMNAILHYITDKSDQPVVDHDVIKNSVRAEVKTANKEAQAASKVFNDVNLSNRTVVIHDLAGF